MSEPDSSWAGVWQRRVERCWWLLAPLIVALTYRGVGGFELLADAEFLIAKNEFLRDGTGLWEHLTHNYFWSSSGKLIPYWRPVTKGSWFLEYQLFGGSAVGYYLVGAAWHVAGVLGVQLLARKLRLDRVWCVVAALIYGLHPVAIAPTTLAMARSDVAGAAAAVWAVVTWRMVRETRGRPRTLWAVAHVICFALALGSKEAAIGLPVLLALWGGLEGDLARARWRRWVSVLPSTLLATAYLVARHVLLKRDAVGLQAVELSFDPLRVFASGAMYLENLFPLRTLSGVRDLPVLEAQSVPFLIGATVAWLVVVTLGWWTIQRRDRTLGVLLAWTGVVLLPVLLSKNICVPAQQGKFALADRWLIHALAPAALASAWLGSELLRRFDRRWLPSVLFGATAVWATLMFVGVAEGRNEFGTEAGMLDNEDRAYYWATPAAFRTDEDHCRFEQRRLVRARRLGRDPDVIEGLQGVIARCEAGARERGELFELLVRAARAGEAADVGARFLETLPALDRASAPPAAAASRATTLESIGSVLLAAGRADEARTVLEQARNLQPKRCRTLIQLAEAERARGRIDVAGYWAHQAYVCGGKQDASLLLAGATWTMRAGDRDRVQWFLAQIEQRDALPPDQKEQLERLEAALSGQTAVPPPRRR